MVYALHSLSGVVAESGAANGVGDQVRRRNNYNTRYLMHRKYGPEGLEIRHRI